MNNSETNTSRNTAADNSSPVLQGLSFNTLVLLADKCALHTIRRFVDELSDPGQKVIMQYIFRVRRATAQAALNEDLLPLDKHIEQMEALKAATAVPDRCKADMLENMKKYIDSHKWCDECRLVVQTCQCGRQ